MEKRRSILKGLGLTALLAAPGMSATVGATGKNSPDEAEKLKEILRDNGWEKRNEVIYYKKFSGDIIRNHSAQLKQIPGLKLESKRPEHASAIVVINTKKFDILSKREKRKIKEARRKREKKSNGSDVSAVRNENPNRGDGK